MALASLPPRPCLSYSGYDDMKTGSRLKLPDHPFHPPHRIPASRSDHIQRDFDSMNLRASVAVAAMLVVHPTAAQDHHFETDPVVTVRENFVACDVLSQLQRVMDNPRFLLTGECDPLSAGRRVRIYASRGPYVCIYPRDTITPCKWTHEKVLSK
jgi:hypothetical protein